jgi:hypothetical protein
LDRILITVVLVVCHRNIPAKIASLQANRVHVVRNIALIQIIIQIVGVAIVVDGVVTTIENILVEFFLVEHHREIVGVLLGL